MLALSVVHAPAVAEPAAAREAPSYVGLILTDNTNHHEMMKRLPSDGLCMAHPGVAVRVDPGSPAYDARVFDGDVLTRADGRRIDEPADFAAILGEHRPGDTIELTFVREEARRDVELVVSELPRGYAGFEVGTYEVSGDPPHEIVRAVADPDDPPLVRWVCPAAAAVAGFADAGIRFGTLISSINGRAVSTIGAFEKAMSHVYVGDLLDIEFVTEGEGGRLRYAAQPQPVPFSGLGLEELNDITRELVLGDSGTAFPPDVEGLYLREVESLPSAPVPSEWRYGIGFGRPADWVGFTFEESGEMPEHLRRPEAGGVLLRTDGTALDEVATFESLFDALAPGEAMNVVVALQTGGLDTLTLERSASIATPRWEPAHGRRGIRYQPGSNIGTLTVQPTDERSRGGFVVLDPLAGLPFPVPYTKVAAFLTGSAKLTWKRIQGDSHAGRTESRRREETLWEARYQLGFELDGDRRRQKLTVRHPQSEPPWYVRLVPSLTYVEELAPFRGQRNAGESFGTISMMFAGVDHNDYVYSRGWSATWGLDFVPVPGSVWVGGSSLWEEPVGDADTESIFGARHYRPNVTEGVFRGEMRSVSLGYTYENACPARRRSFVVRSGVKLAGHDLGGDISFVRSEAMLYHTAGAPGRFVLSTQAHVGTATGDLPRQEAFSLGGKATLPGFPDDRFTGDRSVWVRSELWLESIDIGMAPFVGVGAGNAWDASEEDLPDRVHADVSVGVGFSLAGDSYNGMWGLPLEFPALVFTLARPISEGDGSGWRWQFMLTQF